MDMSKGEQLLVAATEGDIVLVNRLLLSDTDVNYRNKVKYNHCQIYDQSICSRVHAWPMATSASLL